MYKKSNMILSINISWNVSDGIECDYIVNIRTFEYLQNLKYIELTYA